MHIRILIFLNADPDFAFIYADPAFHPDADPNQSSQNQCCRSGSETNFRPDPKPDQKLLFRIPNTAQNDAVPCGSGSAAQLM
jgi:hypothetical protein